MRELIIAKLNKMMDKYTSIEWQYWFGTQKPDTFKYMTDQQILNFYTDFIRKTSMPRAG